MMGGIIMMIHAEKAHLYVFEKSRCQRHLFENYVGLPCCIHRCLPYQLSNKKINTYVTYESLHSKSKTTGLWIQHHEDPFMSIHAMISCLLWLFAQSSESSEWVSEQWHKARTYCFQTESPGYIKPNHYNDYAIKPRIYEPWQ